MCFARGMSGSDPRAYDVSKSIQLVGYLGKVGLIDEECVLDLGDGIEAGLRGVYYNDQIDAHLMRRLSQYAYLANLDTSSKGLSALWRKSASVCQPASRDLAPGRAMVQAAACRAASIVPIV